MLISVIGGRAATQDILDIAYQFGLKVAEMGDILVCGGYAGIMEASAKGAKAGGGQTVGILLKDTKEGMNSYIDIPIVTGIGVTRNSIVANTGDIIVAFPGSYGTLSEICFAMIYKKTIIGYKTWDIEGVKNTNTLDELIALYLEARKK